MLHVLLAGSALLTSSIVIAASVPLLRRRVRMNPLYGVRFAAAFESDPCIQSHRFARRLATR